MTLVDQFNVKADILTDRLRHLADGNTGVQFFEEFTKATLDAIAQVLF